MGAESMSGKIPWRKEFGNDFPCAKDCQDRHMACHTGCIKYMKAKEANDKKKAEIRAKKDADGAVSEYVTLRNSKLTGKPVKSR